jgi:hypothetical protein
MIYLSLAKKIENFHDSKVNIRKKVEKIDHNCQNHIGSLKYLIQKQNDNLGFRFKLIREIIDCLNSSGKRVHFMMRIHGERYFHHLELRRYLLTYLLLILKLLICE